MGELAGRTVLVSGAGLGLGREIALVAAREGASVVLGARRESSLEAIVADVEKAGAKVAWAVTDICDNDQAVALVRRAVDTFGGLDAVVNCAALDSVFGGLANTSERAWRKTLDTNVYGTMNVTRAALPPLAAGPEGGSVVFIGSQTAFKGPPDLPQIAYAASKGALMAAAQHLTQEVGPQGIRVNTVVPGWMWGPSVESYAQSVAESRGVSVDEVASEMSASMPMRRMATDGDVAEVVAFLCSPRAKAVTGQIIMVNAGDVSH